MSDEKTLNQITTSAAEARRQELNKTFEELKDALKTQKTIEVDVIEKIKGGFKTQYKELNIFLPASLYSTKKELDENEINALIGTKLKVKVVDFVEDELIRTPRISHRKYLEEERWNGIDVGSTVEGKVKLILKHALILDANGLDAFVPISKISKQRIDDINLFAKVGDVFKGKVLEIEKEKMRMKVGLENVENPSYKDFFDKYNIGDKITGKVRNIISGGVFIEIAPNVDGFVKASEVSWTRREVDLKSMFEIGKEIEAEIIELDRENSKIGLSYKRLLPNNWQEIADKYQVGHTYSVVVEMIPPNGRGAVVSLNDEIDGFIPTQRMQALYTGNKPNFKAKDVLQVKLLDKDAEKFSLLFESILKPENPYSNENNDRNSRNNGSNDRRRNNKNYNGFEIANSNTVGNFSFADLLSDASKKNLLKK